MSWSRNVYTNLLTDPPKLPNSENNIKLGVIQEVNNLHPLVMATAANLYRDGYYRQAILDTYIMLIEQVKIKSGRRDLDGVKLIQNVFSSNKPVLKCSEDADEQQGFMWLFAGAVMAIRNPKAHRLIAQTDPQRTYEWLAFASVLLRVLENTETMTDITETG